MEKTGGPLENVIPFSYLSGQERQDLEKQLILETVKPGETVFEAGPLSGNADVFIVATGAFVALQDGEVKMDFTLGPGTYFGLRAALFGTPHRFEIKSIANGKPARVWRLKHDLLEQLLCKHDNSFALALATNLRYKQGLFDNFFGFKSFVFASVHEPYGTSLNMKELLTRYKKLEPAIHSKVNERDIVDFDGWCYALRRLPENITSTYSIVCSTRVINVLKVRPLHVFEEESEIEIPVQTTSSTSSSDETVNVGRTAEELEFVVSKLSPGKPIRTEERRRTCWEVMPGKLFVLLRELVSDYLDFITNLCVHAIESDKLRRMLRPISLVVPRIQKGIQSLGLVSLDHHEERSKIVSNVLDSIQMSDVEKAGLLKLWPEEETLPRLLEVLIHHSDFSVYLDSRNSDYVVSSDERWCARVKSAAIQLVGPFENSQICDLVVDIMSSNTHSVLNCLSPYVHSRKDQIVAWGREHCPQLFEESMKNEIDRLYPLAREYFKANPEEAKTAKLLQDDCGIKVLLEREVTGVSVQLYDLNKLKSKAHNFDSLLKKSSSKPIEGRRHLLINIDYCFGSQAEQILRLLILTFGSLIRSINVLGKAGGLTGHRGDILFPTHVLDENQHGQMIPVENDNLDPDDLSGLSGRDVHVGPIITVLGTVLQSNELLRFYERLWHATGMEMEASWYLRAIEEGIMLGILHQEVKKRFLYYVSDTPLKPSSSLAQKMSLSEGIPPLYSITRILLDLVLDVSEFEEKVSPAKKSKAALRWAKVRTVFKATFRKKQKVMRRTCSTIAE